MSQIFNQSLRSSIYSYIGVLIGFLNTSILLPNILTTTELGILGLIKSYGMILTSVFSLGFPIVIVRLFPRFKDEIKRHNGFGTVLLLLALLSSVLLAIFFPIADWLIEYKTKANAPQFLAFIPFILPFSMVGICFIFLEYYSNALKKSTLGSFYKDLVQRIFILFSIGLYAYFSLRFNYFIQLYIASIAAATLLIFSQLALNKAFSFKVNWSIVRSHSKQALSVAGYGLATNIGSILVISIDSIMISYYWPSSDVGIYTTVFFFASLMLVPARSLSKIGTPFIAEFFTKNNVKGVESIYMKSILNQGVVGVFMFFNLIILLPLIFVILPQEFEAGKWVVFFIGLGNLAKLVTGLNFQVINFSNYYKYNAAFIALYVITMILLNLILVPIYGITGAAIASAVSSLIYSISGSVFLNRKFRMPVTENKLVSPAFVLLLIGSLVFVSSYFFWNWIISVILSATFSLTSIAILYFKNYVPDLRAQLDKYISKN